MVFLTASTTVPPGLGVLFLVPDGQRRGRRCERLHHLQPRHLGHLERVVVVHRVPAGNHFHRECDAVYGLCRRRDR